MPPIGHRSRLTAKVWFPILNDLARRNANHDAWIVNPDICMVCRSAITCLWFIELGCIAVVDGVEHDPQEAMRLFRQSADGGNARAVLCPSDV
jgi:hypothetical protein